MREFHSRSPEETRGIARRFVRRLSARPPRRKRATVVALTGDLGAGKTTFAQGFARGLGIKHRIASPTFIIFRSYKLPIGGYERFFHVDAYRTRKISELAPIGFKKILANPANLILIEWAEHISRALPRNVLRVRFAHGKRKNERVVSIPRQ
jgi:tRNA threonylcarbamoyladenosine biosynthesis protein TsaE